MKIKTKHLLVIDGVVNLFLGFFLLLFPIGTISLLGVPVPDTNFYPTILGAVIFGIGLALMIEVGGQPYGIRGLGIAGAIAINFCGAAILILWLLFAPLNLPLRGYIVVLWTIVLIVLIIGIFELLIKP